ncbi:hypothetical protein [Luteimonas sp. e5]
METKSSTHPRAAWRALLQGMTGAFAHWRLWLLWWLAGLLPATLAALPTASLFNDAFGHHPDAARILGEPDLAALIEGLLGLLQDGGSMATLLSGIGTGLLLGALLAPWAAGMLVASLRQGRALGFAALWRGGWREYGRMFRLWLVMLIPLALAAGVAVAASIWATLSAESDILASEGRWRERVALISSALALLAAWSSLEAARAAFATDPRLHSAFRAWLCGLTLLRTRPFAASTILLPTLLLGVVGSTALHAWSWAMGHPAASLLLAQLAVFILAWSRTARLSALATIMPPANPGRATLPVPPASVTRNAPPTTIADDPPGMEARP